MHNNNTQQLPWETYYLDLLKHTQHQVIESAKQILKLDRSLEECYTAKGECDITNEIKRAGLLGEMRIHKDIIRHTHGFVGEGIVKELADGSHKSLVAR